MSNNPANNLNIQGTSEYLIINTKWPHLSYIMPILISLVNSIHLFELCTSHMRNGSLPSFLVLHKLKDPLAHVNSCVDPMYTVGLYYVALCLCDYVYVHLSV